MRAAKPARRRRRSSSTTTASRAAATRSSSCAGLPAPGSADEPAALRARVERLELEQPDDRRRRVPRARSPQGGGIVEERISGAELRSPSVQLRVTPLGEVEILSTHDQLLGRPERAELPRLPCSPPTSATRGAITRRGGEGRRAARARGRAGPLRRRLRGRPRRRTAAGRRTRSRSTCARAARRTRSSRSSSSPTATYDPGHRALHRAERPREAPRGDRPPRVRAAPRPLRRRSLRHRRPAPPALRPRPPDRRRLPHDERARRARPDRA